jgi:hypothetical protein
VLSARLSGGSELGIFYWGVQYRTGQEYSSVRCRCLLNNPWQQLPVMTLPNGAKPIPSSRWLSTRLMKSWVVRLLGPLVANEMYLRGVGV